jgi:hypothetical protein
MSIFSFEKELLANKPQFKINALSSPDIALLNSMGVSNSSVLLANCCIWVEGISDRIYLKRYLELLQEYGPVDRPYFEDLHYAFLEFGGNQVVHYDFSEEGNKKSINALKITNKLMLIHDRDHSKDKRHAWLTKQLGDRYYSLNALETENLLSPEVLKRTLGTFKKNGVAELAVKEFSHADYLMKPIGEFILNVVEGGQLKVISSPGAGKQTAKLLNKAEFARAAILQMYSWEDLSEQAQNLALKVLEFIKAHNK